MIGTRVCHLGKYYPPAAGGIESHVRTLACAEAALGLVVRVYCVNHEAGPTVVEADGAVEVTRFGCIASIAKFDICPELATRLEQVEADIFHVHVPNPTMLVALLRAGPRKPVVVTYHSDLVRQKILGRLFRPIERLAYRQVRAILATSPLYPIGSRFLRPYVDRVHVLPHGIDLRPYLDPSPDDQERSAQLRARYARDEPLWLCAGRHVYYKGFLNAVRALTRVRGRLLLIGEGPERPELRAEAERLGVADRVMFLGTLPHSLSIVPYYLAADAFWFPSNCAERGVRPGSGRGDGQPLSGDQHADPPQRGVVGQPARGDWPDRAGQRSGRAGGRRQPAADRARLARPARVGGPEPRDQGVRPPRHGRAEPGRLPARPDRAESPATDPAPGPDLRPDLLSYVFHERILAGLALHARQPLWRGRDVPGHPGAASAGDAQHGARIRALLRGPIPRRVASRRHGGPSPRAGTVQPALDRLAGPETPSPAPGRAAVPRGGLS